MLPPYEGRPAKAQPQTPPFFLSLVWILPGQTRVLTASDTSAGKEGPLALGRTWAGN